MNLFFFFTLNAYQGDISHLIALKILFQNELYKIMVILRVTTQKNG